MKVRSTILILLFVVLSACSALVQEAAEPEATIMLDASEGNTVDDEGPLYQASPQSDLESAPALNAACAKIAFVFTKESSSKIYTVCPDGSQLTMLRNGGGGPAWSPDGQRLAFSEDGQIFLIDADGSNEQQLTSDDENSIPIWLPGGNQIGFRTTDGEGLWWWRQIDLQTLGISQLTEPSYDFFFQTPAWSPDGQYLAYMSLIEEVARNDGSSQIHIRRVDGTGDVALTQDIWANVNPVWSPDSRKIAFLSERDGTYNMFALYVIKIDGSNLVKLTEAIFSNSATFSWSPDGRYIAISDFELSPNIFIIDTVTGESRALLTLSDGESARMPAWQPGGSN